MKIEIKDQTFSGEVLNRINIEIEKEIIKVKDLIEERVRYEVEEFNKRLPKVFSGLIQPSESEKALNGFKVKKKQRIDPEKQVYIALEAFKNNGFFILVDDEQVESLETEILYNDSMNISFVKLTQLVGG